MVSKLKDNIFKNFDKKSLVLIDSNELTALNECTLFS